MHRMKSLLAVLLIFALIVPALAYSVPSGTIVYITDNGTKYHREGCPYLKSSSQISIDEAIKKGYKPCSRCNPDVLTGVYIPKGSSSSVKNSSTGIEEAAQVQAAASGANSKTKTFGFADALVIFLTVLMVLPVIMPIVCKIIVDVRDHIEERHHHTKGRPRRPS